MALPETDLLCSLLEEGWAPPPRLPPTTVRVAAVDNAPPPRFEPQPPGSNPRREATLSLIWFFYIVGFAMVVFFRFKYHSVGTRRRGLSVFSAYSLAWL
ncbi:hypothetical protein E2562_022266 [Oryza meyeriana var. granulata]|uniref:Uncharacterized protein n=1 Tax=Oryza meyeriana var. granulata TaxID=110450 RepID=A0A6G1D6B8_9ORYZ|nr:hypothetical protein E2562_022266 [Oryza meyeriana var. granulata]